VEQQVARRGNRVARANTNFTEHMQLRRPRRSKESVPRVSPEAHDAGKAPFKVAKFHCAQQRGEVSVSAARPHGRSILEARVYCRDQEDRGAATGCAMARRPRPASGALIGSGFIWMSSWYRAAEFRSLRDRAARANVVDKFGATLFDGWVLTQAR
jgi:hypothetical protein